MNDDIVQRFIIKLIDISNNNDHEKALKYLDFLAAAHKHGAISVVHTIYCIESCANIFSQNYNLDFFLKFHLKMQD